MKTWTSPPAGTTNQTEVDDNDELVANEAGSMHHAAGAAMVAGTTSGASELSGRQCVLTLTNILSRCTYLPGRF